MKVSMPMAYSGSPRDGARHVVELERAGLDMIWVAEPYGFDAPTMMGYLAAKTQTIEIAAGILNIYSRTPGALLQTAAGLDHVSGGRAVLGLGSSGPQVIEGFHGVPYDKPIARTRDIVRILRQGLRREPLRSDGIYQLPLRGENGTGVGKPLKLLTQPERADLPIWLAALGPSSVTMTAEIADGWLPFLFHPERAYLVWGEALSSGLAKRAPELGSLEVCAGGHVVINEDETGVLDSLRPQYALYVGGMGSRQKNFYNDLARQYGYEQEAEAIQRAYLAGHKREAEALVPEEWLRSSNLVGPAGLVRERIEAFREAGVTNLNVTLGGVDPVRTLERLRALL